VTRLRRLVVGVVVAAFLLYVLAVGGLFVFQRDFFYPAPGAIPAVATGFEDVRIKTDDGLLLRGFYRPAKPGLRTLLFFHGNGSSLSGSVYATRLLAAQGYGLLLPEYRGYGGNPGSPSEQGLYRDGEAGLAWLAARGIQSDRVVIIGNSMGSGIATEIAARHKVGGLALVSGFASLVRVAGEHFPFVPTSLLVRDRYDNVGKLGSITCPILLLHGTADRTVPVGNAIALAKAQPAAKLELVPGAGHELIGLDVGQAKILAWLRFDIARIPPSR
jgi:pimeloyl-ACP methyl ester carboxylesterase